MAAVYYAAKCLTLAFTHDIYLVLASQLLDGMAYAFGGIFIEHMGTPSLYLYCLCCA
jgi:hypothetical protein